MERSRLGRLTRNQHVLLRLGELIAWAESAAVFAKRAARAAEDRLDPKADRRFSSPALATLSRIFARQAALKVGQQGLQLVVGGAEPGAAEAAGLETALDLAAIHRAQTGLITDMDSAADAIYRRD